MSSNDSSFHEVMPCLQKDAVNFTNVICGHTYVYNVTITNSIGLSDSNISEVIGKIILLYTIQMFVICMKATPTTLPSDLHVPY